MICLDSNAAIAAINQRVPEVRRRLEVVLSAGTAVGIPAIVLFELRYGIKKSDRQEESRENLARFLQLELEIWPFEPDDAEEAGDIRAVRERAGTPIGPYDILIAAQARRRGAVLVTANRREFARVPGLRIESWEAA